MEFNKKYYAERKPNLASPNFIPETTDHLWFRVEAIPNDDGDYYGFVYADDDSTLYCIATKFFSETVQQCMNYIARCFEIKENQENKIPKLPGEGEGRYCIEVDQEPDSDGFFHGTVSYIQYTRTNLVYRNVLYNCKTQNYNTTRLQCNHAIIFLEENNITNKKQLNNEKEN